MNENKNYLEVIAEKFLDFTTSFACWGAEHVKTKFNTNGKRGITLSERQFSILATIDKTKIDTVTELEKTFHISRSSLSLTIKKMEDAGYVEKRQYAEDNDARIYHIIITDKGREILDTFRNDVISSLVEYFGTLSEEKKQKLAEIVDVFEELDF